MLADIPPDRTAFDARECSVTITTSSPQPARAVTEFKKNQELVKTS